jgi:hypothetical protein
MFTDEDFPRKLGSYRHQVRKVRRKIPPWHLFLQLEIIAAATPAGRRRINAIPKNNNCIAPNL